jgi:hypothetical protein
MIPPPDICPICNKQTDESLMFIAHFTPTNDEKIQWKDMCGNPPFLQWMCVNCYSRYKTEALGNLHIKEGLIRLNKL